ncbi:SPOR domain-containing protein [Neisseria sp. Ec49-e6-T10]|uniref:SPOR domain-containing protein n=1 Tax=Neisseria sp. Ec49-e6-T10 TaxID=3140744 RepID=UPI003EC05C0A
MIGILVGLVVGLIAVGGTLWYINNHKPSYDNLQKSEEEARNGVAASSTVEELAPNGASDSVPEFRPSEHPIIVSEPINGANNLEDSPEVILNGGSHIDPEVDIGEQNKKPTDSTQIKPTLEKDIQPAVAVKNKETIKPVAKRSFLQVGAFKEFSQAENQKAQLALIGVEASIQQIDLGGSKGTFHRVRVGPFTNDAQLHQVQETLKENNIKANVVNPN